MTTMRSTCLLLLASVWFCHRGHTVGQNLPSEDQTERRTIDELLLDRAESLLLSSILQQVQDGDDRDDGFSAQPDWVTKRQHPGKRFDDGLDKRQHPGRREEDGGEQYLDLHRRQHPGKRDDETHSFLELQKRQHPGKRSTSTHLHEDPVLVFAGLSKRQHPGKRYLMLHSKRQHPGRRLVEEGEDEDGVWAAAPGGSQEELEEELDKRQHPGKRFWDNSSPDLDTNSPCDVLDTTGCSRANLLLDFLDQLNRSHDEEKRQHPGKRLAPAEDLVPAE